jgi:hypothetical protein
MSTDYACAGPDRDLLLDSADPGNGQRFPTLAGAALGSVGKGRVAVPESCCPALMPMLFGDTNIGGAGMEEMDLGDSVLRLEDGRLLHLVWVSGVRIDAGNARAAMDAVNRVANGRTYPLLVALGSNCRRMPDSGRIRSLEHPSEPDFRTKG